MKQGIWDDNKKLFPAKPPHFIPQITEMILDLVVIKGNRRAAETFLNDIVDVLERSILFVKQFGAGKLNELVFFFNMTKNSKFEEVFPDFESVRLNSLTAYMLKNLKK